MILDEFKIHSFALQINYPLAYEVWDVAGSIARSLDGIWGGLKINEATPQQQRLVGKDVVVSTGLEQSNVIALRDRAEFRAISLPLTSTFDIWRSCLRLETLSRISARSTYVKEFDSLSEAYQYLIELGVAKWPDSKVFNQDMTSGRNGPEVTFRFQDTDTFSTIRVKAEERVFKAELDKDFVQDNEIEVHRSRVIIDFDRGNTGEVDANKIRLEEWLNGYKHVLRRDLPKMFGR